MSKALGKADITFSQCMCKNGGVYAGPIDGKWSDELAEAENSLKASFDHTRAELGTFDARTEENIQTLLPQAQVVARSFMSALKGRPLTYRIISGTRTYAEQDALYAIGRTVQLKRSPVTNAKGGHSNHNFGLAWDIGVFKEVNTTPAKARKKDRRMKTCGLTYQQFTAWNGAGTGRASSTDLTSSSPSNRRAFPK